jgi:hypothetical protein
VSIEPGRLLGGKLGQGRGGAIVHLPIIASTGVDLAQRRSQIQGDVGVGCVERHRQERKRLRLLPHAEAPNHLARLWIDQYQRVIPQTNLVDQLAVTQRQPHVADSLSQTNAGDGGVEPDQTR